MNEAVRLLDEARAALACNDRELADRLNIGKSLLSGYRHGTVTMPDKVAAALAKLAGSDPAKAVAAIQAEKAPPELRAVWQEIARRAGMLAVALAILGHPGQTPSADGGQADTRPKLSIMLSRLLRRWRQGLHARNTATVK